MPSLRHEWLSELSMAVVAILHPPEQEGVVLGEFEGTGVPSGFAKLTVTMAEMGA